MKNDQAQNESKISGVIINTELNKYHGKVLFPEKLALANKQLKGVKIPPIKNKQ